MQPDTRIRCTRINQRGFSLIEVVVVAGLLGLAALSVGPLLSTGIRTNRNIANVADRTSIVQKIQSSVDCKATISHIVPSQVANGSACELSLVDVYDKSGNLLISRSQSATTKIGEWTLRAVCRYSATSSQSNGIDIELAKPKKGISLPLTETNPDNFESDPLQKGKKFAWSFASAATGNTYSDSQVYPLGTWPCASELYSAWNPGSLPLPKLCPAGQMMTGIDGLGDPICATIPVIPPAGPTGVVTCAAGQNVTTVNFGAGSTVCKPSAVPLVRVTVQMTTNGAVGCTAPGGLPVGTNYNGVATCPPGYSATGGGINCITGFGAIMVDNGPFPYPLGVGTGAAPTGWSGRCCILPSSPATNLQVTAICSANP